MERIKQELVELFEEMLPQVPLFKRKTYDEIFKKCFDKYKATVEAMGTICAKASPEEQAALIEELALAIPSHVKEETRDFSKKKKERKSVDYNMNMAVYVIPVITYTHNEHCEKIAARMVEAWNEMHVTTLRLMQSNYDDISGGFKKKLCYITTAVCESRQRTDDCYELMTLRSYRDNWLMKTEDGRELVEEYYDIAPGIVQVINMQKDAASIYEEIYQTYLCPCIRYIEDGKKEQCEELYKNMVHHLQKKYIYS